jgi:glycyl-tRNA synthetase
MEKTNKNSELMEKLVSLSKRRGFVYQGSEIYGGLGGVYDFGPYGVELANNIKKAWWKEMVQENENVVGLDSAIFMPTKVWEASGHVGGFSDPMVECKECQTRSRADHILEDIDVVADEKMTEEEIDALMKENKDKVKCPKCRKSNFADVKNFNMLVKSNLANFTGDWDKEPMYLRGETAQGIFVNFKNVVDTTRMKVPFGIAQVGKAFRNEIAARQFIFRKREFEQMEMQMFVHPDNAGEVYKVWKERRWKFYTETLRFKEENITWHQHENLVFYAKDAWDIEYNFPIGMKELEGIHARSDYDLTQHSKFSGQDLSYLDPKTNERFVPHVVETSVGLDRLFFAVLSESYTEETMEGGSERVVLKLPKQLAPVKVAVFPLLKNKPELVEKAREVFDMIKGDFMCEFDDNGNVGKRYRRQDEIGTPFCVTVDFETIENEPAEVTVRDRDTGEQVRVAIGELSSYLKERLQ